MLIEIIVSLFLSYFNYTQTGYASAGSFISKLIMLSILQAISILKKQSFPKEPTTFYWFLLFITTISSIIIVLILFRISELPSQLLLLATLSLLTINVSHFIIYTKLSNSTDILLKNQIMQQQIDHYQNQFAWQKINDNSLRKERHNLKNQLITIRGFALQNQNIAIIKFINKLLNDDEFGLNASVHCNNLLINTLLNTKTSIAQTNHITYTLDLQVPPTLPFNDVDLCVLIGNSLDNAFEAAISCYSRNPFVEIIIHYKIGCLYFHFSNSYSHSISPNFHSTKKNYFKHGYGLQSIKSIVEKYNGTIEINTENSVFSLKLFLYTP